MSILKFATHNPKLAVLAENLGMKKTEVVAFDIPAGWTCPKACICKAKADKITGKITRFGRVLCYAAKAERYLPNVRAMRWYNFDMLKSVSSKADLINESLPKKAKIVRIHSSGDFFNLSYFRAWLDVANYNQNIQFFGYTKDLNYVIHNKPDNISLVYSWGGLDDSRYREEGHNSQTIPTCFVEETAGQYPDEPLICGEHDKSYEDYQNILDGNSFKIGIH